LHGLPECLYLLNLACPQNSILSSWKIREMSLDGDVNPNAKGRARQRSCQSQTTSHFFPPKMFCEQVAATYEIRWRRYMRMIGGGLRDWVAAGSANRRRRSASTGGGGEREQVAAWARILTSTPSCNPYFLAQLTQTCTH
jgi:hypothetical protein